MEEIEDNINQFTCKLSSWFYQFVFVMMQFIFKLIYNFMPPKLKVQVIFRENHKECLKCTEKATEPDKLKVLLKMDKLRKLYYLISNNLIVQ